MELLYVWIETYKNIKKQGFNFSPKHWFEYDEKTNTLKHEERNQNYPDNFFDENISNVTAIVGKNGSGKSNLLKLIFEDINQIYCKHIFIFSNHDKFQIKSSISNLKSKTTYETTYQDITCIYFNPFINTNSCIKSSKNKYSICSNFLLKNADVDFNRNIKFKNPFVNSLIEKKTQYTISPDFQFKIFQTIEFSKQIQFSLKYQNLLPFRLPNKIRININNIDFSSYGIKQKLKKEFKSLIANETKTSILVVIALANRIIETFFSGYVHRSNTEKDVDTLIKLIKETNNIIDFTLELIKHTSLSEQPFFSKNAIELIIKHLSELDLHIEQSNPNQNIIDLNHESSTILNYLMNEIGKWNILNGLIDFNWRDISDGEYNFISLLSRFEYVTKNNKSDKILILLDEPENQFHPQWQKEIISKLLATFPTIMKCNLQLLITSHSPFLVSDLPKENIIFLDKNKETGHCKICHPENMDSTFGANIHSLYRNSFFLENGLMGEFAKGKIDGVIKDLNLSNKNLSKKRQNEMKFIIEQIGEPLIKDKLLQKYKETFEPIEDRISELKLELERLEASRKN